jgi:hypothetical protein
MIPHSRPNESRTTIALTSASRIQPSAHSRTRLPPLP